ncbi:MAG: ribbon-helix-helix protein, CopG family [Rhodothermia bacterium]
MKSRRNDVATVRALENLAERWVVSKSEVVRRAIRQVARSPEPLNDALDALGLRLAPLS